MDKGGGDQSRNAQDGALNQFVPANRVEKRKIERGTEGIRVQTHSEKRLSRGEGSKLHRRGFSKVGKVEQAKKGGLNRGDAEKNKQVGEKRARKLVHRPELAMKIARNLLGVICRQNRKRGKRANDSRARKREKGLLGMCSSSCGEIVPLEELAGKGRNRFKLKGSAP